jgi:hypothetical protein
MAAAGRRQYADLGGGRVVSIATVGTAHARHGKLL